MKFLKVLPLTINQSNIFLYKDANGNVTWIMNRITS